MERTFQDTFKEQLSSTNEKTILNVLSQASGSLFYEITEATDIDLEICIESIQRGCKSELNDPR